MGALTMEIEKVNKNMLEIEKREREIEQLTNKKEQEKEKKQYEKDLLIACKNDLTEFMNRIFEECLNDNGVDKTTLDIILLKFYDIETRNKCIAEYAKTIQEQDYLNQEYDKILHNVFKKWQNHVKYVETYGASQEALRQKEERKKGEKFERTCNAIGSILKWSLIVIFAPIILLFMFIAGLAKGK